MPAFPIVDSHVHFWDPGALRYSWLDGNALLDRPYLVEDFDRARGPVEVEAIVFVECDIDPELGEAEAAWVAHLAEAEPRIKGMVAWAPLEEGERVEARLERLSQHPVLRGVRRLLQAEPDPEFCLRPDFIDGVRALAGFGLSFDIGVKWRQMASVLTLCRMCDDVPMILDHIGKPAVADGVMEPWRSQMQELARMDHVVCKLSGVATEADHKAWTLDELRPYIDAAIEAFGFDRILFGGDWPVASQAVAYPRWVEIVDEVLAGESDETRRKVWRDNAARFYRLAL